MRRDSTRNRQLAVMFILLFAVIYAANAEQPELARSNKMFLLGGDVSALTKIEDHKGVYRDKGREQELLQILNDHGCNCSRLRLFVEPNGENLVVNDLEYTLALAKRIRKAGHTFLLDLHYSDTWADPGKQFTPQAWSKLTLPELEQQVTRYTTDVIRSFKAEGVTPDIVQVGNEVVNGMLWPQGKIQFEQGKPKETESWGRFSRLLNAGIAGVKAASASEDEMQIMVHIDRGGDWQGTKYFFDRLEEEGVDFDIIGQSFYPWWHGTLEDLKENLSKMAGRYEKPILIVETGYPNRGRDWLNKPNMAWEISSTGQAKFLRDVVDATRNAPHGLGAGVLYWYPEAIPVRSLHIWEGGSVGLFDEAGNSLPALKSFSQNAPSTSRLEIGRTR